MKIIHTSDWHLGQSFFNKSRLAEHKAFLAWLQQCAIEQKVDAIIVAGDIFDTTAPPSYARELYHSFAAQLAHVNIQLVVLGGNHDSVAVLNETRTLLQGLSTFVVPSTSIDIKEQVLVLNNHEAKPGAVICAVPYIRPYDVQRSQAGQTAADKAQSLEIAIVEHYQNLYELAQQKQAQIQAEHGLLVPIIATGHLAALGVKQSESVRDIYIGTLNGFSVNNFPKADYIALGHIHKPQALGGCEHIRYSGSPIALSFDELGTQKQVCLVEFSGTSAQVSALAVPVFQELLLIKGDLDAIKTQIQQLKAQVPNKNENSASSIWLSIEIEKQGYLSDLNTIIDDTIGTANIELLKLTRVRNASSAAVVGESKETLSELNPSIVFERRLALEQGISDAQQQRLKSLFNEAEAAVIHGEDDHDQALVASGSEVLSTEVTSSEQNGGKA